MGRTVGTATEASLPRIGLLLAGGASTRMGRDKAGLDWQGRPLIAHMHALLSALPLQQVVVSGSRPEFGGIVDESPGRGPLGGIASAAQAMPDCELLVLAVDTPGLSPSLLQRLLNAPASACVRFGESPLPMRLRLDSELRGWLRGWLRDAEAPRALHRLQARLQVQQLQLDPQDLRQLANLNTPEEWAQAQAGLASTAAGASS